MRRITFLFLVCTLIGITASSFTFHNPIRDWEKLGERRVNFKLDRDEIFVTRNEGTFKAIKLKAEKGGVNFHKLVVHFGNGDVENFEVRENIAPGGWTRTIDLPGNKRIITKVVFWYDTKNSAKRRASVELWGLQ